MVEGFDKRTICYNEILKSSDGYLDKGYWITWPSQILAVWMKASDSVSGHSVKKIRPSPTKQRPTTCVYPNDREKFYFVFLFFILFSIYFSMCLVKKKTREKTKLKESLFFYFIKIKIKKRSLFLSRAVWNDENEIVFNEYY